MSLILLDFDTYSKINAFGDILAIIKIPLVSVLLDKNLEIAIIAKTMFTWQTRLSHFVHAGVNMCNSGMVWTKKKSQHICSDSCSIIRSIYLRFKQI